MTNKKTRRTTKRQPLLTLRVSGPDIRDGHIPIPDLLVICANAQSAIDRQAEAMEGKRTLRPGPTSEKVRHECTLELSELGKGSAVLSFVQAKPQTMLPDMRPTLGQEAAARVAATIVALARGESGDYDPGVLDSLNKMGEVFDNGVRSVEWIAPQQGSRTPVRATYNRSVRTKVAAQLKPATSKRVGIDGILEMADFKATEHRCRIHPPLGPPINCTFDAALADDIYNALRHPVHIEGTAMINAESGRTESIDITELTPLDPLTVNAGNFFQGWTFDQLVSMQAVRPLRDVKTLAGGWPQDEDVDEVMTEIYRRRH